MRWHSAWTPTRAGGWHEFRTMLEKGSLDIYQPDATFGGGIRDACRVMQACREQGLTFAPHTWTNGIGLIINLHVYAAGGREHPLEYPFEPPGWVPEVRDGLLAEPIRPTPTARSRCRWLRASASTSTRTS